MMSNSIVFISKRRENFFTIITKPATPAIRAPLSYVTVCLWVTAAEKTFIFQNKNIKKRKNYFFHNLKRRIF